MVRIWTLLCAVCALVACADDTGSVDRCPGGDLVDVDGGSYCVAEAVVIEK